MTAPRDYHVMVIYRGRVHELLASAATNDAALKTALKKRRTLRQAVRRGEASWEVRTS